MTRRRSLVAILVALLSAAGAVACGGDGDGGTGVTADTAGPGEKRDGTAVTLKARLTGAEEVPGPGIEPGVGAFTLRIAGTEGCYDLNVTMGETPTKAHIHEGASGAGGPVAVDLAPTFEAGESAFTAASCVDLAGDTAAGLLADPGRYYVNVHSAGFPDGALRGQLAGF